MNDNLPSHHNEADLILRAKSGDQSAIAALFRLHRAGIERVCRKMCRGDESFDDVLQETYLGILRSLGSFRGDSAFLTWAYTVARTYRGRYVRSVKRHQNREAAVAVVVPMGLWRDVEVETSVASRELGKAIGRAMAGMSDLDQRVLEMRDIEGLTAVEVAQALRLTVPAVKTRLHRARAAARRALVHVHRDFARVTVSRLQLPSSAAAPA